jgi:hypothetical protein
MSLPKILNIDLSSITFDSSANEDDNYPLTNLMDYNSNSRWRSVSVAPQVLYMTFSTDTLCDTIVLENHNLYTAGTSVILQTADDASFTTNVQDIVTFSPTSNDVLWTDFTAVSKRYWRIYYPYTLNYLPYIGNIFIGKRFEFPYTQTWSYKADNREFVTKESIGLDGVIRTSQMYDGRTRYELSWKYVRDDVKTDWIKFIKSIRGKFLPFYFRDHIDEVNYMLLDSDYTPMMAEKYNLNDLQTLVMKKQFVALTPVVDKGEEIIAPNLNYIMETDEYITEVV